MPVSYSVVIPFFNEEECCRALLAELRPVMDGLGAAYEVLAVDDGSRDGTLGVLREEAASWPQLRVLALERNSGQAAALYTAMRRAEGSVIVTLDGDGQNVPGDIPALLDRLDGADMVAGIRAVRRDSVLRRLMSRIANGIRGMLLRDGMTDSGCALKVFRREVVDAILPLRTLYSFMPAMAVAAGFRVTEHPVGHRPRKAGVSKYGLWVMLWRPLVDMLGMWWWRKRRFRLPVVDPKKSS